MPRESRQILDARPEQAVLVDFFQYSYAHTHILFFLDVAHTVRIYKCKTHIFHWRKRNLNLPLNMQMGKAPLFPRHTATQKGLRSVSILSDKKKGLLRHPLKKNQR